MTNQFPLPVIEKLSPPPWAGDAPLAFVYRALNDGPGTLPCTLFVGGCVRNAVLGRPPGDYDLATTFTPDQVAERAARAGIRVVPTGIDHGTVTCVYGERGFEVTTLRRDISTDGRHAVVGFTDDWVVDASRRDFTMNTLLADLSGQIFEPIPGALSDTRAGSVHFVGNAPERIAEDYLRILRFFRFHAHYGVGDMDAAALAACTTGADNLATLSRERVTQEILKWLRAARPGLSLKIAIDAYIFDAVMNVPLSATQLDNLAILQDQAGLIDVRTRLFALAPAYIPELTPCLTLSTKQVKFLHALGKLQFPPAPTPQHLRAAIYAHGAELVWQRYMYDLAAAGISSLPGITDLLAWVPPTLPVTGDDLIADGLTPGPELGARLIAIEQKWIDSDFQLDKKNLLG